MSWNLHVRRLQSCHAEVFYRRIRHAHRASRDRGRMNDTGDQATRQPDPNAGYEAAAQVARGGKLPERYRPAARRVLMVIVSLPIAIGLTPFLYKRLVLGEEPKSTLQRSSVRQ